MTRPYLDILAWSILPLLLYAAFRRYLQGMGDRPPGDGGARLARTSSMRW